MFLGVPFFDGVFTELGCSVEWLREEGEYLEPVTKVAIVKGEVRKILQGERLALNCLSRASGAATISKKLKDKATSRGWKGQIAGITPKNNRLGSKLFFRPYSLEQFNFFFVFGL